MTDSMRDEGSSASNDVAASQVLDSFIETTPQKEPATPDDWDRANRSPVVDDGAHERLVAGGVVALAIAVGLAFRLWLLFHQPISSDEASAGMLAQGILHGHFHAYYPGQVYGGAEPYVLALFIAVLGQSGLTLHLEPMVLSAVAAVLVWRISLRLVRSRAVAALTAALVFSAPAVNILSSNIYQGRGVTMVCGLICLLCTLRLLDDSGLLRSRRGLVEFIVLGLAAGVGWWSLPEMIYFLGPAGLLLIAALLRGRGTSSLGAKLVRIGLLLGSAILGALPWLWTNIQSNFSSLAPGSLTGSPTSLGSLLRPRLHLFGQYVLPMQLGLREEATGVWFASNSTFAWLVASLAFGVVGLALLGCIWQRGRAIALVVGLLCFPILYSENPGAWYWQDGRYAVYLGPLLAMAVAVGVDTFIRPRSAPRWSRLVPGAPALMSVIVIVACALSVLGFHDSTGVSASTFAKAWGYPDASTVSAIDTLESAKIVQGYADYWVAYKLDYLSGGKLVIDTSGIGADLDRFPSIDATVLAARRPAWIFVRQAPIAATSPFMVTGGPNGESESVFLAALRQAHIRYRVVDAGPLEAVIARQRVRPREYPGPFAIGG